MNENVMNNQYQLSQTAAPFSASLAMAFFADHFLKVKTDYTRASFIYYIYRGGTNVPCQTNVQVDTKDLADNALSIAFWYLCENNRIRFTNTANQVSKNVGNPYFIEFNHSNQVMIPGLEFDLMEIIKHSAPNMTIETVVKIFLQKKLYHPEVKILERLTQWFIQLGYGQPTPPKGFGFVTLTITISSLCRITSASPVVSQQRKSFKGIGLNFKLNKR